mmetsp:Transcript_9396/g.31822  ORF Transcript_9396/g.31822 Transcript_9396/m.31822 type:complete len:214 (+) Transcript_9396:297-938(+)
MDAAEREGRGPAQAPGLDPPGGAVLHPRARQGQAAAGRAPLPGQPAHLPHQRVLGLGRQDLRRQGSAHRRRGERHPEPLGAQPVGAARRGLFPGPRVTLRGRLALHQEPGAAGAQERQRAQRAVHIGRAPGVAHHGGERGGADYARPGERGRRARHGARGERRRGGGPPVVRRAAARARRVRAERRPRRPLPPPGPGVPGLLRPRAPRAEDRL